MRIEVAHLDQGIDFAVFGADATNHTDTGRQALLARLTAAARRNRPRVDKAALAYQESGRIKYFGTPDLVNYLASRVGRTRSTSDRQEELCLMPV